MKTLTENIKTFYSRADIVEEIKQAYKSSGHTLSSYLDTARFDEFHIRGREATRELATLAGFSKNIKVLDLGCGIGGPARTIAAESGCVVTGVDIVGEYISAAAEISEMVNLSDRAQFRQADITSLPFPEKSFDAVYSIHSMMNIKEKEKVYAEAARVLKPGGAFAMFEIIEGDGSDLFYPIPWADGPGINFLVSQEELLKTISEAGFCGDFFVDETKKCLDWFLSHPNTKNIKVDVKLGLELLMGNNIGLKIKNLIRNLQTGKIKVVLGVFKLDN